MSITTDISPLLDRDLRDCRSSAVRDPFGNDEAMNFWLGYTRLLGLRRREVMVAPTILRDYAAMIDKLEEAGDFKFSARLKGIIIDHYARKNSRVSR